MLVVLGLGLAALPEIFPDHGVIESAILAGDRTRVGELLDRGADPNTRSAALSEISHFFLRVLNPSHSLPNLGQRPPLLIIAITHGELEIAKLLLDAGADPNARDERGYTPLSYATLTDDPDLVAVLIARGADPALEMPDGSTALREGAALGYRLRPENAEVIDLLESYTRE